MLTYKEGSEVINKLLNSGAADVLSQPFQNEVVSQRVSNVIEAFWAKQELTTLRMMLDQASVKLEDKDSLILKIKQLEERSLKKSKKIQDLKMEQQQTIESNNLEIFYFDL